MFAIRQWAVATAAALLVPLPVVAQAAPAADTATVTGTVWVDRDRDGTRDPGEPGLGGVVVSDGLQVARTRADGSYTLALQVDRRLSDLVAVTLPSGYGLPVSAARTPQFYRDLGRLAAGAHANADFGLLPDPKTAKGEPNFVNLTDVHVYDPSSAERATGQFQQLNALAPEPDFILLSGDLTYNATPTEFENYQSAAASSKYPIWTSPGNHELKYPTPQATYAEAIDNYRHFQGPEWYSFDYRNMHIVMLDNYRGQKEADQLEWLRRDLAQVDPGRELVAAAHVPFSGGLTEPNQTPLVELLRKHNVKIVLSGHVHGNDVDPSTFPGGRQIVTSPATDPQEGSPEGFRRIVGTGDGTIATPFTAFDRHRQLTVVNPAPGTTVPRQASPVLINAYDTSTPPARVAYRVDGGDWHRLRPVSRWSWTDEDGLTLRPGSHRLEAVMTDTAGKTWSTTSTFTVATTPAVRPHADTNWPTLQGDNQHTGQVQTTVSAPLNLAWVYHSGGAILSSSPVVADGVAYVGVRDEDGTAHNGIAAIDPVTGRQRWRQTTDAPVDATPTVAGGLVYASTVRGTVLALDARTGHVVWQVRNGVGQDGVQRAWAFAGPVVADGVVYQSVSTNTCCTIWGGTNMLALDARTGKQRWNSTPATDGYGSTDRPGAPTIAGDLVLFTGDGRYVTAIDRATGTERWRHYPTIAARYRSAPAVSAGRVYLQGQGKLEALDLATGNVLWKDADPGYNEGRGTPAVSGSVVVSPIGAQGIAGFDAATGRRLWTTTTGGAVESSPVISGDTVYAGAKDGKFSALDLRTGKVVWTHAIGTWVNSSAAVSGNLVMVGAYDGNVYGFRS